MHDERADLSIAEFSRLRGVSERTAQLLAQAGLVEARKVRGRWMLRGSSQPPGVPRGRPLSPPLALRVFCELAGDGRGDHLATAGKTGRHRVRIYAARAHSSPAPAALLRGWFRQFDIPRPMTILSAVTESFLSDRRVAPTGASLPGLRNLFERGDLPIEVYVGERSFDRVQSVFGLRPADAGLPVGREVVLIHVPAAGMFHRATPGVAAIDLARHPGPLNDLVVRRLLQPGTSTV